MLTTETHNAIRERYLEIGRSAVGPNDRVLKTDAYNESTGGLPLPGGIAHNLPCRSVDVLERDADTIARAEERRPADDHVTYLRGDVRNIPYWDGSFDVVLDFSTLDHVPFHDVPDVLDEYARVLALRSRLELVVWTTEGDQELNRDGQRYFPREKLTQVVRRRFDLLDEVVEYTRPECPTESLVHYSAIRDTLTWDYLMSVHADVRHLVASGWLQWRGLRNATLVELNCGECRLPRYLDESWASYIANDVRYPMRELHPGVAFLGLRDDVVAERLSADQIDVLLLFGLADGRVANPEFESTTICDSFLKLAHRTRPRSIVLEISRLYEQSHGTVRDLCEVLPDYVAACVDVDIRFCHSPHRRRSVYLLSRIEP